MLPALLKKLLIVSDEGDLATPKFDKASSAVACFQYTFLGNDGAIKGEVVLAHKTNTYSNFSLTTFGLAPTTSPEGVFSQKAPGKVLIDFKVNFAEGDEMDSLKGTLTILDWELKKNQGRWKASVRSAEREVAMVKGTWSRYQL
jgi:hypothetical protein